MNPNSNWSQELLGLFVQQGPVPKHVGFIMDGNRRYGKEHKMSLEKAYQTGLQTFESVLEFCFATGIHTVTVYAFSLANFQRSTGDVGAVMGHLKTCISRILQDDSVAKRFGVGLRICGDRSLLPADIVRGLEHAEKAFAKNSKHVLNLCLAYGSRHEIAFSVRATVMKHSRGLSTASQFDNLSQQEMTSHSGKQETPGLPISRHDVVDALENEMFTAGSPPMDILIRTSDTRRLSDFMLWQCHEATDIVILKRNWPELKYWDLAQVLGEWQLRTPRVKCIEPVIQTPDVLHILMSWLYLVFQLFLRVTSAVGWYSRAINTDIECRLHEEVSFRVMQKDAGKLKKLPTHLSVILHLTESPNALERTMGTVADMMIWCSCMGIPLLSVYERTGTLKASKSSIHKIMAAKFPLYYAAERHPSTLLGPGIQKCSLLLLSAPDGRDSLADICNALTGLVGQAKLSPDAIDTARVEKMLQTMLLASVADSSSPKDSIVKTPDLTANTSKDALSNEDTDTLSQRILDPDLLFIFGSRFQFEGYPPWQLAYTEIFCTGEDSAFFARRGPSARYRIFLRGLQSFAGADIKLGR